MNDGNKICLTNEMHSKSNFRQQQQQYKLQQRRVILVFPFISRKQIIFKYEIYSSLPIDILITVFEIFNIIELIKPFTIPKQ